MSPYLLLNIYISFPYLRNMVVCKFNLSYLIDYFAQSWSYTSYKLKSFQFNFFLFYSSRCDL